MSLSSARSKLQANFAYFYIQVNSVYHKMNNNAEHQWTSWGMCIEHLQCTSNYTCFYIYWSVWNVKVCHSLCR